MDSTGPILSNLSNVATAQPFVTPAWAARALRGVVSPEFGLLCACCMWPESAARAERVSSAVQKELDWDRFLWLTDRHRVHGLVAHSIGRLPKNAVPEPVAAKIAEKAGSLARDNLRIATECVRIARLMQSAGIPVAFLKGVPLALTLYGDFRLRHSWDIDLLVPEECEFTAHQVLTSAGYKGATPAEQVAGQSEVSRWFRDNRHIEYLNEERGISVELHVRMFANPLLNQPFGPDCWELLSFGGTHLRCMKRQELVLYLCVHGAAHGWFRLKWVADIGAFLAQATGGDIRRLLDAAEHSGIQLPVLQAMQLSSLLLGTAPVQTSTAPGWREKWLTRIALRELSSQLEPRPDFHTTRIRLSSYLFRTDWHYLSAQLRCDSTSEADRQLLALPNAFSFVYVIFRPFTWVIRRILKYWALMFRQSEHKYSKTKHLRQN